MNFRVRGSATANIRYFWKIIAQEKSERNTKISRTARATQFVCIRIVPSRPTNITPTTYEMVFSSEEASSCPKSHRSIALKIRSNESPAIQIFLVIETTHLPAARPPCAFRCPVLNFELAMSSRIDIPLASLLGAHSASFRASSDAAPSRSFFIETFGCQMNVHDSEKVAGVLLARGYRQVESADSADMVLFNTCSIREKAAQKVFTRLGDFRGPRGENKIVGVLGCVAQQEGEQIFKRAPWVSMVCGSASYRNLPQMLDELETGNSRVTGLTLDTDETFETKVTRRDNPFRAYLTIIEGCEYACSYCVVPHT